MHVRGAALDRRFQNAMKQFHARSLTGSSAGVSREKHWRLFAPAML
jgi:hypothetical protein